MAEEISAGDEATTTKAVVSCRVDGPRHDKAETSSAITSNFSFLLRYSLLVLYPSLLTMHVERSPAARIVLQIHNRPVAVSLHNPLTNPDENSQVINSPVPFSTIRTLASAPFYCGYSVHQDPFLPSPDEFFEDNPLLAATLQTKTQRRYAIALHKFLDSIPHQDAAFLYLDHRLSICIQEAFLQNPKPGNRQEMANLLSMILVMHPNLRHELGLARRCLSGWRTLRPSKAVAPFTSTLVHAFAYHMLRNGKPAFATALMLSFFACLRISEALKLSWTNLALPGDVRLASYEPGIAGINIVDAKTSRYTGRLQFVKLSNASALSYLQQLHSVCNTTDGHVAPVSYAVYNSHLEQTAQHFGFKDIFSSHSARIGKATEDFLRGVPPHDIAIQCRWKSINSLRYYLTNGKAWILDNNVSQQHQLLLQTAATSFSNLITAHQTSTTKR